MSILDFTEGICSRVHEAKILLQILIEIVIERVDRLLINEFGLDLITIVVTFSDIIKCF